MLGIIAGSRVANIFEDFKESEERVVTTPYGAVTVTLGVLSQAPVAFLTRHGHTKVPPHKVPYLTNMWALADVGVDKVVATSTVNYGLCRMFEILQEVSGASVEHATFKTLEEAYAWLGVKPE